MKLFSHLFSCTSLPENKDKPKQDLVSNISISAPSKPICATAITQSFYYRGYHLRIAGSKKPFNPYQLQLAMKQSIRYLESQSIPVDKESIIKVIEYSPRLFQIIQVRLYSIHVTLHSSVNKRKLSRYIICL